MAMQTFFTDFETLNRFSLSLDYHKKSLSCQFCLKNDEFVSHGIIYKQRSISFKEPVGKRIFCSNRYGRTGCGRTVQLYIQNEIPSFQYGAAHLFIFISSLIAHQSVDKAYQTATGTLNSRHAWRWMNKLMGKLSDYRICLNFNIHYSLFSFSNRSTRLQLLLPTLVSIFNLSINKNCINHCLCQYYQSVIQRPFL